jgi:hypothetical protein
LTRRISKPHDTEEDKKLNELINTHRKLMLYYLYKGGAQGLSWVDQAYFSIMASTWQGSEEDYQALEKQYEEKNKKEFDNFIKASEKRGTANTVTGAHGVKLGAKPSFFGAEGQGQWQTYDEPSVAPEQADAAARIVLGVSADATPGQIKAAYYKLAKQWHPDSMSEENKKIDPEGKKFKEITAAYEVLASKK